MSAARRVTAALAASAVALGTALTVGSATASAANGTVGGYPVYCVAPDGGVHENYALKNAYGVDDPSSWLVELGRVVDGATELHPTAKAGIEGQKLNLLADPAKKGFDEANTGDTLWIGTPWRAGGPYGVETLSPQIMVLVGPSKAMMDRYCGGTYYGPGSQKRSSSTMYWVPRYIAQTKADGTLTYVPNPDYRPGKVTGGGTVTDPSPGAGGGTGSLAS